MFDFLKYFKASEAGVHRPHVSGIHGREDEGAFSIVLAGGYEDDLVRIEISFFTNIYNCHCLFAYFIFSDITL